MPQKKLHEHDQQKKFIKLKLRAKTYSMPPISVEPEAGELNSQVEASNEKIKPVRGYEKSGNYEGNARNGSLFLFQEQDHDLEPVTGQIDQTQFHRHQMEPDMAPFSS